MKCTIPGPNARGKTIIEPITKYLPNCLPPTHKPPVLAKAVQSFARVGAELFIEAQPDGLSIRTVNRTKSAFAMILFRPEFFTSYDMAAASSTAANHCKVSVKSCMSVFKSMRNVEELRISMDAVRYKLKFEFSCRLEMTKTHYICVLEQESLQAVFHAADSMPNVLTAGHKLFEEIVGNFQANEEELTLDASGAELVVKNFVEGATVDRRYMRSQMVIK